MLRRTSPRNRVGRLLGVTAFVAWMLTLASLLAPASCSQARDAEDGLFHWTITTVVEIDASPARVWRVLVDLPAYREWNPFIVEASGTVAVGETLSLRMVLPGRDPMTIEPRLLVVEPERELRWKGRLLVPGLFDGEHVFALTPLDGGGTRLHHWERFGGFLLPIARPLIYEDTVRAFHALNAALAARASGRTSVGNGRSNSGGVRSVVLRGLLFLEFNGSEPAGHASSAAAPPAERVWRKPGPAPATSPGR